MYYNWGRISSSPIFYIMDIIITGASRGIGYQLAKILASDSQNRLVVIARNNEALLKLQAEVKQLYSTDNVFPVAFDLSDIFNNSSDLKKDIFKHITRVDILVNNAGFLGKELFEDVKGRLNIDKIFNVNFFAPAELIRLLLPALGKGNKSHVVNIGSVGGFQGSSKFPGLSYYSASKAAIASLTECLAEEFKNRNIAFNCLALGSVQTEMLEEAFPDYVAPLKAYEMAEFIADFAQTGHKYFNGKILPVSISTP